MRATLSVVLGCLLVLSGLGCRAGLEESSSQSSAEAGALHDPAPADVTAPLVDAAIDSRAEAATVDSSLDAVGDAGPLDASQDDADATSFGDAADDDAPGDASPDDAPGDVAVEASVEAGDGSPPGPCDWIGQSSVSTQYLATGLDGPSGLAIDATHVYFSELDGGTVKSVLKTGGPVTTLATGQGGPADVAVDDSFVYWTNNTGGSVMRVAKDGSGTPSFVATANQPVGLVVDSTTVYWYEQASPYSLVSAPIAGGSSTTLATGLDSAGDTEALLTDGTYLYFVGAEWDGTIFEKSGATYSTFPGWDAIALSASLLARGYEECPIAHDCQAYPSAVTWYTTPDLVQVGTSVCPTGVFVDDLAINACGVFYDTTEGLMAAPFSTQTAISISNSSAGLPTTQTMLADDAGLYYFSTSGFSDEYTPALVMASFP